MVLDSQVFNLEAFSAQGSGEVLEEMAICVRAHMCVCVNPPVDGPDKKLLRLHILLHSQHPLLRRKITNTWSERLTTITRSYLVIYVTLRESDINLCQIWKESDVMHLYFPSGLLRVSTGFQ